MDVQQKRLALFVDSADPQRPRLRKWIAIPLPPEPEREEHDIDGVKVRCVAVGNRKIESALASTARHGATADMLHPRI
jgi:hypothetical protein